MIDRELLELAARAVGIEGYIHEWINGPEFIIPGDNPVTWNPLANDGDAFRMAVKLQFAVKTGTDFSTIYSSELGGMWCMDHKEPNNDDPYAATRRAVVRAAAEIGKAMT